MSRINYGIISVLVFLFFIGLAMATPHLIPLQGVATDTNGNPITGDLTVRIYNESIGGALVYDSGTNFNGTIENGIFDVLLGSITPLDLDNTQKYWMEIQINTETITPRQEFYPGSGEHHARNVLDAADGSPTEAVYVDNEGNVGIGTSSPNALLDVGGAAGTRGNFSVNYADGGCSYATQSGKRFSVTDSNDRIEIYQAAENAMGIQTVRDCGTIADVLSLNPRGGRVGIGTESPGATLDVRGSILLSLNSDDALDFGWGTKVWRNSLSGHLVLEGQNGVVEVQKSKLGIGTMSPGYELDVNGSANAQELCIAGDCKNSWPSIVGDNLGNHIATTSLNMNNFPITNINWAAGSDDGPGSGLDADTLDGKHASDFSLQCTMVGPITGSGTVDSPPCPGGYQIVSGWCEVTTGGAKLLKEGINPSSPSVWRCGSDFGTIQAAAFCCRIV